METLFVRNALLSFVFFIRSLNSYMYMFRNLRHPFLKSAKSITSKMYSFLRENICFIFVLQTNYNICPENETIMKFTGFLTGENFSEN